MSKLLDIARAIGSKTSRKLPPIKKSGAASTVKKIIEEQTKRGNLKKEVAVDIINRKVKSANLAEFSYDKLKRTLRIKFVSGAIYEYSNVSIVLVNGLERAKSKGTYFNRYMKHSKKYTVVNSLHINTKSSKPR